MEFVVAMISMDGDKDNRIASYATVCHAIPFYSLSSPSVYKSHAQEGLVSFRFFAFSLFLTLTGKQPTPLDTYSATSTMNNYQFPNQFPNDPHLNYCLPKPTLMYPTSGLPASFGGLDLARGGSSSGGQGMMLGPMPVLTSAMTPEQIQHNQYMSAWNRSQQYGFGGAAFGTWR